jgi:hypothetical protein
MKKFFSFLPALLLVVLAQLALVQSVSAQGTDDDGFILRVTGVGDFAKGDCGYSGTSGWGGSVTTDFCAPVVWFRDAPAGTADSLGCEASPNNYAGQIVMIRRGGCEFGAKALSAQNAGAIGVIVVNHFTNAADNGCTAPGMGAGAVGAQVTIPTIMVGRDLGALLDAAINAGGGTAEVCYVLPRLYDPYAGYHFATPVSQVDTMNTLAVRFVNRSGGDLTGVTIKADIETPSGAVSSISTVIDIAAGVDSLVFMPNYGPPAELGTFEITYSNSYYTEPRDSVKITFLHSQYSFATDIVTIDPAGVGPTADQFAAAGFKVQNAGLCIAGPNGGKATHATLGVANLAEVVTPDPSANIVGVILYDADADGDGNIDLGSTFDDLSNGIVGFGEVTLDTLNFQNDVLFSVPLTSLDGNASVDLIPGNPYYISLLYDGNQAGTGICVRFSNTLDRNYFVINGGNTTPLYLDQLYSGWSGAMVIQRLELEGYTPPPGTINTKPTPLADSKFNITPNPASDVMKVNLDLESVNPSVGISLVDYTGRIVETKVAKNFQNGQFTFDTDRLPSGNYLMWIRTAEGTTMKPVAVCH